MQNGLRLADLPAELAGVLTGTLLLVAIGLDRHSVKAAGARATSDSESLTVKNSQVAVICGAILAAALVQRGGQFFPGPIAQRRALRRRRRRRRASRVPRPRAPPITVAMMPKSKGNAYFIACRKGAEEAARELGVKLIWDGPTDPDPAKQNEVIDTWITRGVDVIAVAVENREGICVGAAQGTRARHQGADLGRRRRPQLPAISSSTRRRPKGIGQTLDGQRRPRAGRQGIVLPSSPPRSPPPT